MEVDDQSQRDIEQFHVAEQLRLRDGKNFFDGFAFYKQTPIDQEIKAESHLALKLGATGLPRVSGRELRTVAKFARIWVLLVGKSAKFWRIRLPFEEDRLHPLKLLVPDDYALLILDHVASQLEFPCQAPPVNRFE